DHGQEVAAPHDEVDLVEHGAAPVAQPGALEQQQRLAVGRVHAQRGSAGSRVRSRASSSRVKIRSNMANTSAASSSPGWVGSATATPPSRSATPPAREKG